MRTSKLITILIMMLALVGCSNSQQGTIVDTSDIDRVIDITAKRFEFSPSIINVKQGEKVKLMIQNTDTRHGIVIPSMGIADVNEVILDTSEKGEFDFRCATVCGRGHREMAGIIVVE